MTNQPQKGYVILGSYYLLNSVHTEAIAAFATKEAAEAYMAECSGYDNYCLEEVDFFPG